MCKLLEQFLLAKSLKNSFRFFANEFLKNNYYQFKELSMTLIRNANGMRNINMGFISHIQCSEFIFSGFSLHLVTYINLF